MTSHITSPQLNFLLVVANIVSAGVIFGFK